MDVIGVLTACTAVLASFAAGWWFLSYSLFQHLGSERDVTVQVGTRQSCVWSLYSLLLCRLDCGWQDLLPLNWDSAECSRCCGRLCFHSPAICFFWCCSRSLVCSAQGKPTWTYIPSLLPLASCGCSKFVLPVETQDCVRFRVVQRMLIYLWRCSFSMQCFEESCENLVSSSHLFFQVFSCVVWKLFSSKHDIIRLGRWWLSHKSLTDGPSCDSAIIWCRHLYR